MTELKRIGLNALVVLPVAAALVAWALLASGLPIWVKVALCSGAACLLGYLFLRSCPWLFGPVLFYELIRGARTVRVPVLRVLYALVLLLALSLVYLGFAADSATGGSLPSLFEGARMTPNQAAAFANTFFQTFMAIQFGLVFLLTPAFVAGSISGEKQSGTLDFLLASDLSAREIVLGKLASRLANLLLLLLTGLPVLSFLQLMGGVDPNILLAAVAATLLTVFSQGALSMAASTLTSRPRDAIFSVYVLTATYIVSTGLGCTCCALPNTGPFNVFGWLASGNIFTAWMRLMVAASGGSLASELTLALAQYTLFHGLLTASCLGVAMWTLRRRTPTRAIKAPSRPRRRPSRRPRARIGPRPKRWRPWIGDRAPMIWKEFYFEPGLELPDFIKGLMMVAAALALGLMALVFFCGTIISVSMKTNELPTFSNGWLRLCGPVVAQVVLLGVALRAASTFSREREQKTLDSLLTTPLSNAEILWSKWAACLWNARGGAIALAVMYTVCLFTGGLCPFAVPLVLIAVLIHAAFAATLGMVCSLTSTSTLRSTITTVVALAVVGAGHWLIALFLLPLAQVSLGVAEANLVYNVHLWGLTPPCNLAAVCFYTEDWEGARRELYVVEQLVPAMGGLALYLLGTGGMLLYIRWRMQSDAGRVA